MFHTPAIEWTKLQAEAIGIHHLTSKTSGVKEKELEDLIYCALCFFCTERDPDMPEPPRDQCEPFVKKIIMDLKPTLDENDDGVISREEFELFGQYLNGEYEKLQKEILNGDAAINIQIVDPLTIELSHNVG